MNPGLPSIPPKMYIPPASPDQAAAWPYRMMGREPLGVICCQELPCIHPNQRIPLDTKLGYTVLRRRSTLVP